MPAYDDQSLYKTLSELEVIDKLQLEQAVAASKLQHIPLEKVLLDGDLISDENLGKVIAELVSLPLVRLSDIAIPADILHTIPEVVAKKQRVIAFKKDKKGLHIAMADPKNLEMAEFIKKKVGLPVIPHIATSRDIDSALTLYAKDVTTVFDELISESVRQVKGFSNKVEPSIIKIVNTIITYAYRNKASDVHVEPGVKESLVRFRIDGVLHDIIHLPSSIHPQIVTRVKVLAKLRTDEHQAPQDGKMQVSVDSDNLDIRVSIVPITDGEKIVMRLLSERSRQFSLATLGLSEKDLNKVIAAYEKPYGMILATGPTGSGKTTTMYAILKLLNKRDVNIMTIEDPVEYDIEGINQIQVNTKTSLTFANGLRSILRQDPNIILVGEVRDEETANIAINAAMTGHLVLSTLHTNDAGTAIPRLFDMGIEPFLVASTVNVIIAQRLVRKVHTRCRVSEEVDSGSIVQYLGKALVERVFGDKRKLRLYHGKGCDVCHDSGYEDRIGIFEVLLIDADVRKAITNRSDAAAIRDLAVKHGMKTMIDDGLEKVKEGITTIDEVLRVTKE